MRSYRVRLRDLGEMLGVWVYISFISIIFLWIDTAYSYALLATLHGHPMMFLQYPSLDPPHAISMKGDEAARISLHGTSRPSRPFRRIITRIHTRSHAWRWPAASSSTEHRRGLRPPPASHPASTHPMVPRRTACVSMRGILCLCTVAARHIRHMHGGERPMHSIRQVERKCNMDRTV